MYCFVRTVWHTLNQCLQTSSLQIGALMFRLQFWSLVSDAKAGMAAIREASSELKQSQRLHRVLATVLAAGNALNQGTARGNASALKLETLLKLADVKTTASGGGQAKLPPVPKGKENGKPQEDSGARTKPGLPAYLSQFRSLLDYIAWVICSEQGAGKNGDADTSLKYLGAELPALGEAVRRMQTGALCGFRLGVWFAFVVLMFACPLSGTSRACLCSVTTIYDYHEQPLLSRCARCASSTAKRLDLCKEGTGCGAGRRRQCGGTGVYDGNIHGRPEQVLAGC